MGFLDPSLEEVVKRLESVIITSNSVVDSYDSKIAQLEQIRNELIQKLNKIESERNYLLSKPEKKDYLEINENLIKLKELREKVSRISLSLNNFVQLRNNLIKSEPNLVKINHLTILKFVDSESPEIIKTELAKLNNVLSKKNLKQIDFLKEPNYVLTRLSNDLNLNLNLILVFNQINRNYLFDLNGSVPLEFLNFLKSIYLKQAQDIQECFSISFLSLKKSRKNKIQVFNKLDLSSVPNQDIETILVSKIKTQVNLNDSLRPKFDIESDEEDQKNEDLLKRTKIISKSVVNLNNNNQDYMFELIKILEKVDLKNGETHCPLLMNNGAILCSSIRQAKRIKYLLKNIILPNGEKFNKNFKNQRFVKTNQGPMDYIDLKNLNNIQLQTLGVKF